MCLINKKKRKKSRQILGYISEMSNSNSESSSTDIDESKSIQDNKKQRINLKVMFIKKRNRW